MNYASVQFLREAVHSTDTTTRKPKYKVSNEYLSSTTALKWENAKKTAYAFLKHSVLQNVCVPTLGRSIKIRLKFRMARPINQTRLHSHVYLT